MPRKKTSEDISSTNETMDGQEQSPEVAKGESSKGKSETAKPGGIWLPTGSTVLDLVVGAGRGLGHEAGQVINLVSESQGGKTALVNEAIANAYWRLGDKFKWEYDSTCENGNTFDTKKLYGFDIIPKKGATRSKTIQDAFGNIMSFLKNLKSDEFGIYALDSVDAVVSDEIEEMSEERLKAFEKGKDFDKGSYQGQKARFLSSEFLPQVTDLAETKNCLIILISQLRDNIGGGNYAPKDKIAGGRALLFYCSSRIWLKTKAAIEVSGREIGVIVQADTRKARGPRPYRKGNYIFYYEYGIDDIGGNIDFLYGLRTEAKAEFVKDAEKQALSWDGKTFTRKELIKYIEDNGQAQELREAVITMWDKIEEEANKEVSERKRRF